MKDKFDFKYKLISLLTKRAQVGFTISTGRTGTSTIIKLLNISNKITAYHEPKPLFGEENIEAFRLNGVVEKRVIDSIIMSRAPKIIKAYLAGKIYVEHSVMVALLPGLSKILNKSNFIHIFRHPASVVRSGFSRGWFQNHPWDKFRVSPDKEDPIRELWDNEWKAFEKICWFWNKINSEALNFQNSISPEKFASIQFEKMINFNSFEYEKIYYLFKCECPDSSLIKKVLMEKTNNQKKFIMPNLSKWDNKKIDKMNSICGETMKKLGYETL